VLALRKRYPAAVVVHRVLRPPGFGANRGTINDYNTL
jgi:hypothetical protein